MACLIHESMSVSSRNYHSVQHIFDVAQRLKDDPIAVLAALYHDVIYFHVDGGLSDRQFDKLQGAVIFNDPQRPHMPSFQAHDEETRFEDPVLCMVEGIFGYHQGESVTHKNGLNEYLSAVIAVRELEPFLPMKVLAEIAAGIEATIPFRPINKETGKTCMDKLYDKIVHVNQVYSIGMSEAEMVKCVQRAAVVANADLANFGSTDHLWFLDNTWSLLPESDEGLRRNFMYTLQQFQFAIFKTFGFFGFLQPNVVFPHFQNSPSKELIEERQANAARNIEMARKYSGAKLLSLSILCAIAELSGGDAPISLFVGDLPGRHGSISPTIGQRGKEDDSDTGSDFIAGMDERLLSDIYTCYDEPNSPWSSLPAYDRAVFDVLSLGRRTETSFDIRQSPLAATLYRILGDEELEAIFRDIKVYPMTTDAAWTLLRRMPREALRNVMLKTAKIATTRTDKIMGIVQRLQL